MPEAETSKSISEDENPERLDSKYVYGIISCGEPREFTGVVYTVCHGGLAAVVSDSPRVDYERSKRYMMLHTRILEEVMRDFVVLPVRFGAVGPDEEAIREKVLDRRSAELESLLRVVENRAELGLKAFWREDVMFREIVAGNADIRRLRDRLAGQSAEKTYYERIRLGEMIEAAINRKRDADADAIMARLRPLAYKSKTNKALGDRIILNAAFLVDNEREAEFDQTVRQLEAEDRQVLKYVGPVPPYNFVTVVINWEG